MKIYRFVQDGDGHWYLIDARKEQSFELWVRSMEDGSLDDFEDVEDFEADRISGSPSNYTFTSPKED